MIKSTKILYFLFCLLFVSLFSADEREIIIRANPPAGFSGTLFICGGTDSLGSWSEHKRMRQTDNGYIYTVDAKAGQNLEFKFTQGDWSGVEKGSGGLDIPNRSIKVGSTDNVFNFNIDSFSGSGGSVGSTLSGNVVTWSKVYSRALKNERTVLIWLPPSYETAIDRHYPVLYLNDGNNKFDAATAFGGVEWGFDETADSLMTKGEMEEVIMVAVYNTAGRMEEYTPFFSVTHGGGHGNRYLHFLIKDLKPRVDREFRTKTGPEHTAIAGSSLGGLISLYAVYEFPHVFGRAGVISPSLWWANEAILKWVQEKPVPNVKIWLDMGTREGNILPSGLPQTIINSRRMRDFLLDSGFIQGKNLFYHEAEGAGHNETSWAARGDLILKFLFPSMRVNRFGRLFQTR